MSNEVIKTLAFNKQVRIFFIDSTALVKGVCSDRGMNKTLCDALGRTVTIAGLTWATLKGNQRVSIKINSTNKKFKIFADVDSLGNVRGYANEELLSYCGTQPYINAKENTLKELIGNKGSIHVLKDLGMNSMFTGITDMPFGNITDDFSYFFDQSEQIPTLFSVYIGYNESNQILFSRGIMAQLLPGAPISLMHRIKEILSKKQSYLEAYNENLALGEIPSLLFEDVELMELGAVQFFCGCSKEMFYPMLYSLSKEELVQASRSKSPMEMVCNICGRKYYFSPEDIGELTK